MDSFGSFDGVNIAYEDRGSGPVVVLLHGFAADHRINWFNIPLPDELVRRGRRVVAPDARGHGASDKPHDPEAYSHDAMVKDVSALLDHLGVTECSLAGYSMGALIGARVALADPRVCRLVLGGIGGGGRPSDMSLVADALLTNDPGSITNPTARAFRAFADSTGADRLALAAVQRGRTDSRSAYEQIAVPTLVVTGESDPLVADREALARTIPGARNVVVSGNHLTAIADPRFSAEIADFIVGA